MLGRQGPDDTTSPQGENVLCKTDINIETRTPSLDILIRRLKEQSIQTKGYFQRNEGLWDATKQSLLIESILIGFPMPSFFFDATDDGNWLVVDGLQRLSTIRGFVQDGNELVGLQYLPHLNGEKWETLPTSLRRTIEETQTTIHKIMPGTPTEVKYDIFKRINTGGLVLSPQEIRQAIFQGKASTLVAELAVSKYFIKATGGKIPTERMTDKDFSTRFLAFFILGEGNYGSITSGQGMDGFMCKAMTVVKQKTTAETMHVKNIFDEAMKLAIHVFGDGCAFRKTPKGPINIALFEALSVQFARLSTAQASALKGNALNFKEQVQKEIQKEGAFANAISTATASKKHVAIRHSKTKEIIHQNL